MMGASTFTDSVTLSVPFGQEGNGGETPRYEVACRWGNSGVWTTAGNSTNSNFDFSHSYTCATANTQGGVNQIRARIRNIIWGPWTSAQNYS